MNDWLETAVDRLGTGQSLMRVVMASVRGSAPRETGACMLVGPDETYGSIGGGTLEWQAVDIARSRLSRGTPCPSTVERFALGARLGQCCGGAVELWFDPLDRADLALLAPAGALLRAGSAIWASLVSADEPTRRAVIAGGRMLHGSLGSAALDAQAVSAVDALIGGGERARQVRLSDGRSIFVEHAAEMRTPVWLFGAGHVGQALVRVLADLPFAVTWIDSRDGAIPARLPPNVRALHSTLPQAEVAAAPHASCFLVMTHDHALDYAVCRAILQRPVLRWAGLIGSETKATCFGLRLAREDIPAERIAQLVSPIGVEGIDSKLPAAIAVAVAAQLLQVAAVLPMSRRVLRPASFDAGLHEPAG